METIDFLVAAIAVLVVALAVMILLTSSFYCPSHADLPFCQYLMEQDAPNDR